MASNPLRPAGRLTGHALRNANLCRRSLRRAASAPPLARAVVTVRVRELGMTRLELARQSGIGRGTLRDLELGLHHPTRRVMQRLLDFCQQRGVSMPALEELRLLYAGPAGTLAGLLARLQLKAGSAPELARRVGISPSTLWEYRRGHFPLPLPLLRDLCRAAGEDPAPVEAVWQAAERQRLLDRGYPEPLAEFWALCNRAGYSDKDLPRLGLGSAALRRMRYLEVPAWEEVTAVAECLCRCPDELAVLRQAWERAADGNGDGARDRFGPCLQRLRKQRGVSRRELADLFGIRGKKPAQAIKHIEEDGVYSAAAFPAGLAAILAPTDEERAGLLRLWEERRARFHRRHRPETRVDLRLKREAYGLGVEEMEAVLGYSPLEYQRIERGVTPCSDTARARILAALEREGERRVAAVLERQSARLARRTAWRAPASVAALVVLLAEREGGLVPLARALKRSGVRGVWPGRLRAIASGAEVPAWPVVERIAGAGGVEDLSGVRADWEARYRGVLEGLGLSPLAVEVRLLIGEAAESARAFSVRLPVSYPSLTRDLQRIDRGRPVGWGSVERILRAAGAPAEGPVWARVEAWWYGTVTGRARRNGAATRAPGG